MNDPVELQARIDHYVEYTGFPRSLFISEDGRIVGTWIMGNDYSVKSGYYGGYPAGYLKRVKGLFPEKQNILHLFSGKVDLSVMPGDTLDINPAVNPTIVADAHALENVDLSKYDLIMADPPYSIEDAERYQTSMIKRNTVMRQLARGCNQGCHVCWLDQAHVMYRKDEWDIEGAVGVMRSTNHRFRMMVLFRRL